MEKFSADPFVNPGIRISQPDNGYRFSMDPLILAAHVQPERARKIIDAGCGCAVISLILSLKHPDLKIVGVEIQKELYDFAWQNVAANQLEDTIKIINNDIQNVHPCDTNGKADIIVSNPPFKKKNTGRRNPDCQKAIARHEITLDIDGLFESSDRLLKRQGKIYIIFPAERLSDLFLAMERYGFGLDTIRFVHIKKDLAARRVIVCAKKGGRKYCRVDPPLYLYSSRHIFTDEYNRILADAGNKSS